MYFATELRYLGKGSILSRDLDGNLIVNIEGMGKGKVAPDMAFARKRDALDFARVPQQRAGWRDAAKLGALVCDTD